MTDYEIQKATAAKVGVVSPPDNIYGCRKAILEKLGGDSTDADTIYECDKRILPLIGSGSANLQSKSVDITENGTTTYSPDSGFDGFSDFSVNVDVPPTPVQLKSVEITENGTTSVLPDEGYNLSKVDVNVSVPPTPVQIKSVNITENGTTSVLPDEGYNLSKVNLNVNVNVESKKSVINAYQVSFIRAITIDGNIEIVGIEDCRQMFYNALITSIPKLDTSNVNNMSYMFAGCSNITSIPQLDTSKVKNMSYMFQGCKKLITIPTINTSNVNNIDDMFGYSYSPVPNLTNLGGLTNMGKAFTSSQTLDISTSSILTNQSVQNLIDTVYDMNLNTKGVSATLKLSQSVINSMTDTQKSQLAAKGWTLTN